MKAAVRSSVVMLSWWEFSSTHNRLQARQAYNNLCVEMLDVTSLLSDDELTEQRCGVNHNTMFTCRQTISSAFEVCGIGYKSLNRSS